MSLLGRLIATVVDDVITEYRKLSPSPVPVDSEPLAVTAADIERAPSWDHDKRAPAVAASERPFGFRSRS